MLRCARCFVQIFAAGGFAAPQMALGLVFLHNGLYLGPQAGILAAQAVLVLPDGGLAHAEHNRRRPHGSRMVNDIPSHCCRTLLRVALQSLTSFTYELLSKAM